jgi:hypothetical protein
MHGRGGEVCLHGWTVHYLGGYSAIEIAAKR